jgi:hypothetical protein
MAAGGRRRVLISTSLLPFFLQSPLSSLATSLSSYPSFRLSQTLGFITTVCGRGFDLEVAGGCWVCGGRAAVNGRVVPFSNTSPRNGFSLSLPPELSSSLRTIHCPCAGVGGLRRVRIARTVRGLPHLWGFAAGDLRTCPENGQKISLDKRSLMISN